jgi:putative copper export protein
MKNIASLVSHFVTILALGLWLGGMLTLGAVVAPVVFSVVPLPTSADAMTVVFRRFDAIAITCAALVLFCELWRVNVTKKLSRIDIARGVALTIAGLLALYEGMIVSPRVEELHRAGAVRGSGDLGMQLESAHSLAEAISKGEAFVLVVFILLYAIKSASSKGGD